MTLTVGNTVITSQGTGVVLSIDYSANTFELAQGFHQQGGRLIYANAITVKRTREDGKPEPVLVLDEAFETWRDAAGTDALKATFAAVLDAQTALAAEIAAARTLGQHEPTQLGEPKQLAPGETSPVAGAGTPVATAVPAPETSAHVMGVPEGGNVTP